MSVCLVALLRGINVGRNKRIAMADLRALLTNLGYSDVQTCLQSGNAIFSGETDASTAAAEIEQALVRDLGLQSTVIVRSAAELAAVVAANPLHDIATDPSKYLVGFLAGDPSPTAAESIPALNVASDQVRLIEHELYLWCPSGVLDGPFGKVRWDRQLGTEVTMRNWKTVTKLAALAGA